MISDHKTMETEPATPHLNGLESLPSPISDGESSEVLEDVDERRLNRIAYEYLCRCEEVRT